MTESDPERTQDRPRRQVLIVDDHAPFREVARRLLSAAGFEVVGEAADGVQAVHLAGQLRPDVVLLDIQLPGVDGFHVATQLSTALDPPAVVLVSSRSEADYGGLIERSGALAFIAKADLTGAVLRHALRAREGQAGGVA